MVRKLSKARNIIKKEIRPKADRAKVRRIDTASNRLDVITIGSSTSIRNVEAAGGVGSLQAGDIVSIIWVDERPVAVYTGSYSYGPAEEVIFPDDPEIQTEVSGIILQYPSGEQTGYPVTEDGFTSALNAAEMGSVIYLPACRLVGNSSLMNEISIEGVNPESTMIFGTIQLVGGASMNNLTVIDRQEDANEAQALLGPTVGTCQVRGCHVLAINCGTGGDATAITLNGGSVYLSGSTISGEAEGQGYAVNDDNGDRCQLVECQVYGSTDFYTDGSNVYVHNAYDGEATNPCNWSEYGVSHIRNFCNNQNAAHPMNCQNEMALNLEGINSMAATKILDTTISPGNSYLDIVADEDYIYWANCDDGTINRMAWGSITPTSMTIDPTHSSESYPVCITLTEPGVIYAFYNCPDDSQYKFTKFDFGTSTRTNISFWNEYVAPDSEVDPWGIYTVNYDGVNYIVILSEWSVYNAGDSYLAAKIRVYNLDTSTYDINTIQALASTGKKPTSVHFYCEVRIYENKLIAAPSNHAFSGTGVTREQPFIIVDVDNSTTSRVVITAPTTDWSMYCYATGIDYENGYYYANVNDESQTYGFSMIKIDLSDDTISVEYRNVMDFMFLQGEETCYIVEVYYNNPDYTYYVRELDWTLKFTLPSTVDSASDICKEVDQQENRVWWLKKTDNTLQGHLMTTGVAREITTTSLPSSYTSIVNTWLYNRKAIVRDTYTNDFYLLE